MRDRPPDPHAAPFCREPALFAPTIGLFMTFNPKDASRTQISCEVREELRSYALPHGKRQKRRSPDIERKTPEDADCQCPQSFQPHRSSTYVGAISIQTPRALSAQFNALYPQRSRRHSCAKPTISYTNLSMPVLNGLPAPAPLIEGRSRGILLHITEQLRSPFAMVQS